MVLILFTSQLSLIRVSPISGILFLFQVSPSSSFSLSDLSTFFYNCSLVQSIEIINPTFGLPALFSAFSRHPSLLLIQHFLIAPSSSSGTKSLLPLPFAFGLKAFSRSPSPLLLRHFLNGLSPSYSGRKSFLPPPFAFAFLPFSHFSSPLTPSISLSHFPVPFLLSPCTAPLLSLPHGSI